MLYAVIDGHPSSDLPKQPELLGVLIAILIFSFVSWMFQKACSPLDDISCNDLFQGDRTSPRPGPGPPLPTSFKWLLSGTRKDFPGALRTTSSSEEPCIYSKGQGGVDSFS